MAKNVSCETSSDKFGENKVFHVKHRVLKISKKSGQNPTFFRSSLGEESPNVIVEPLPRNGIARRGLKPIRLKDPTDDPARPDERMQCVDREPVADQKQDKHQCARLCKP